MIQFSISDKHVLSLNKNQNPINGNKNINIIQVQEHTFQKLKYFLTIRNDFRVLNIIYMDIAMKMKCIFIFIIQFYQ